MKLYELDHACRLYARFTDSDKAITKFRAGTRPDFGILDAQHRSALLTWLNEWGCRQFAKANHTTASESINQGADTYLKKLPSEEKGLLDLDNSTLSDVPAAFNALRKTEASRRGQEGHRAQDRDERTRKDKNADPLPQSQKVTVGSTGAAKIFFAVPPNLFPPWDGPIRTHLKYDGSGESYLQYLKQVQTELKSLKADVEACGLTLEDLRVTLQRPESSLPKLIDEYNWVTCTRRCPPPSIEDLKKWLCWAQGRGRNGDKPH